MASILSQSYGSQADRKGYKSYRFRYQCRGKKVAYTTIKGRNLNEVSRKFKNQHKDWMRYDVVSIT